MRIARWITFAGLLCAVQASAQQAPAQQAPAQPPKEHRRTAVRVFDEDTMADVTAHLAYGGEAPPSAPAKQEHPAEPKPEAQPGAAAAATGPMTPEELDKLRARQQSLE